MQYSYAQRQRNPARHVLGIVCVILLHVVLIYALVTGLARKVVEVIRQPIEAKIIQEVKPPPPDTPPPPPPPKLVAPPPPFIPPPEVQIQTPPQQTPIAVATTKPVESAPMPAPAPTPAPAPVHQAVVVAPVIDAKHSCVPPDYPASARRLEYDGTVVLRFLIDTDGRVVDSKVQTSSGHDELDTAARDALSRCRFKPGTVDGNPQQSWANLRYVWKLQ